jgi:hypothetical protein
MFSETTAVFLADFGVACTSGASSFKGILDAPDDTLSMGGVNLLSTMYQLTVHASDVQTANIKSGTAITVAGVAYVVRDVLSVDDGVFNHLTLTKP